MKNNLTFGQYLSSKERLIEAIKQTPIQTTEYVVVKYCKLPMYDGDNKCVAALKPTNAIIVEWEYSSIESPTIISIRVLGNPGINEDCDHTTLWEGDRTKRWLFKNTVEKDHLV